MVTSVTGTDFTDIVVIPEGELGDDYKKKNEQQVKRKAIWY